MWPNGCRTQKVTFKTNHSLILQTGQSSNAIPQTSNFSNEILKREITAAVSWADSEQKLSANKTGERFLTVTSDTFLTRRPVFPHSSSSQKDQVGFSYAGTSVLHVSKVTGWTLRNLTWWKTDSSFPSHCSNPHYYWYEAVFHSKTVLMLIFWLI